MEKTEMISEESCGAVVFTRENGDVQYVIVQSKNGIFGFPKGHVERGETQRDTALREVLEETGLTVHIIDGFQTEDCYCFMADGEEKRKHIVYYLATYSGQTPTPQQTELDNIYLMHFDDAMQVFQFESSRRILTQAHNFLKDAQFV